MVARRTLSLLINFIEEVKNNLIVDLLDVVRAQTTLVYIWVLNQQILERRSKLQIHQKISKIYAHIYMLLNRAHTHTYKDFLLKNFAF